MNSIIRLFACLVLVVACASSDLVAQIPRTFSLQGVLTDAGGKTLPDGTHEIRVTLYTQSAGGSGLYAEIHSATIRDGVFSIVVGSVTPIPGTMIFDRQYFAGISVDGGADLSPRTPVTAVPYALNAIRAEEAAKLSPGATGVVTTVNGVEGAVTLVGGGSTTVTRSGQSILINSAGGGSTGIAGVQNTDGTIAVTNPNGPVATIGVAPGGITATQLADNAVVGSKLGTGVVSAPKIEDGSVLSTKIAPAAVTAQKIANGAVTLDKLNTSGAAAGQVPMFNGGAVAWTTPAAGGGGLTLPYSATINNAAAALDITNNSGEVIHVAAPTALRAIYASTESPNGGAIWGESKLSSGIYGESESYHGIFGLSHSDQHAGVDGYNLQGIGVSGHTSSGYGVRGISASGKGVVGASVSGTAIDGSSNTGTAVKGVSTGGMGVYGESTSATGIYGLSESNDGVVGKSDSGDGVVAQSNSGYGVYSISGNSKASIYGFKIGSTEAIFAKNGGNGSGLRAESNGGIAVSAESNTGEALRARTTSGTGNIITAYVGSSISNLRFRVLANGNVRCDGAFTGGGADLAEAFDFEGNKAEYEPGDVLVISSDSDAKITRSSVPYSHMTIGVYATKPGVLLAHTEAESDISDLIPVGVVGVIPTKVCTENGPIRRGDLLTTSSRAGVAMKVHPVITNGIPSFPSGIILGKALENFEGPGNGLIRVFVNSK